MTNPFDVSDTIQMKGTLTGVTRFSRKAKRLIFLAGFFLSGYAVISIVSMNSGPDATETQKKAATDPGQSTQEPGFQPAKPPFAGIEDGQAGIEMQAGPPSHAQDGSVDLSLDGTTDAQANASSAEKQNSANAPP